MPNRLAEQDELVGHIFNLVSMEIREVGGSFFAPDTKYEDVFKTAIKKYLDVCNVFQD